VVRSEAEYSRTRSPSWHTDQTVSYELPGLCAIDPLTVPFAGKRPDKMSDMSASCSPTSGALTADDCVRRVDGYGSATPSPSGQLRFAPSGRRCPPRLFAGIGEIEHIAKLLAVVHGRIRRIPLADQLVRLVQADMVLVAVGDL